MHSRAASTPSVSASWSPDAAARSPGSAGVSQARASIPRSRRQTGTETPQPATPAIASGTAGPEGGVPPGAESVVPVRVVETETLGLVFDLGAFVLGRHRFGCGHDTIIRN